jgi:predicted transglutaminase-like cysteine proteinase
MLKQNLARQGWARPDLKMVESLIPRAHHHMVLPFSRAKRKVGNEQMRSSITSAKKLDDYDFFLKLR